MQPLWLNGATMMQFKKPSWFTRSWDPAYVTDDMVEAWRKETEECDEYNKLIAVEMRDANKEIISKATELWGPLSKQVAYLKKQSVSLVPAFSFEWNVLDKIKKHKEAKKMEEAKIQKTKEMDAKCERAVLWLQARGLKLGDDFSISNAYEKANELAATDEIQHKVAEEELHSFYGDDYCEDCGGWDGVSRRCECGNRRVEWVTADWHDFENPSVLAEAY
jgi:hypothetical protein